MDTVTTAAQGALTKASDLIASVPIPEQVTTFYSTYFGDLSAGEFMADWAGLTYVTVLPLLCLVFAVFGCCAGPKHKMGTRVLRRVNMTIGTAHHLLKHSPSGKKLLSGGKKYVGVTSLSELEKGGSPIKNKAADKAQEAAIKKKAADKNPRRY